MGWVEAALAVAILIMIIACFYMKRDMIDEEFSEDTNEVSAPPPHFHVDRKIAMPTESKTYWKHVKSGGMYTVLHDDAEIESTLERAVVYRSLEGGRIWVRPHAEFFDGRFVMVSV
jgi:hypothetical protein